MWFIINWFKTKSKSKPEKVPRHIAIIMDGNGRWAKKRGMPRNYGHREGARNLNRLVKYCNNIGIKYLTVYAFSTENWSRPKSEVDAIMDLLSEYLQNADKELSGKDIRIRVIGRIEELPVNVREKVERVVSKTAEKKGLNLIIALNYGGRDEIVSAAKKVAEEVKNGIIGIDDIDESLITNRLYTANIPDPDLVIRPSGEKRISNFLIWQSSYSEFWFSRILWPDFNEKHLLKAISDFYERHRRFGGITD